jgi:hypothetical protein
MSSDKDLSIEGTFRKLWVFCWARQTVEQIESGERDSYLEEDLTFEDLGVQRAAKARLETLKGFK